MQEIDTTPAPADLLDQQSATWQIDGERSSLAFTILQFGATTRGHFANFDVEVTRTDIPGQPVVVATVAMGSIATGNDRRDKHLRSVGLLPSGPVPGSGSRAGRPGVGGIARSGAARP